MRILLTHEQADFDALASLLGASLLDETAIPVLPRRMNRNVQAFLTLYGVDLPFVDPRDLPTEPVEAVTLVDTQSMVSIKGVGPDTTVAIIDHHPPRENLPAQWSVIRADTGATTTMIIEALRERDSMLTPIQATLLLLGIYEDTGSLTFSRTTARDLRAAAHLLEQGASLRIATDFLNHPLSQAQQAMYDLLRMNAEYLSIHGHNIVITIADAQDMDEEFSTITHKLRDLLDPDALFVLIKSRGGVQMIARSSTDHIDVSELVAHFGGGGHERAAAGLIHGRSLEDVRNELVNILPNYIRPAITVAQIMSREPQVLSLSTPVEEAALKMARFGYEGYPVVQDGKVVGLLTRRDVDRAISHHLQKTASSLMNAGEYTVHPGDSIEYLQRLMTESGWGQIPVVHPDSGQIIAIVTRTDLLKTLAPESRLAGQQNLAGRLEAVLPPERIALLQSIAEAAHEQHSALFLVGGFVRDLWLNLPSFDFDLVVEGDAIKLAQNLAQKYGGRVTSHGRFGTSKWHLDGSLFEQSLPNNEQGALVSQTLDLVSARTEFYTYPTALPTVERGSIELDLHRRDFTINTLALRLDGTHYGDLYDYWGGLNDLRSGWVRVLHSLSFVDDPTRMLRAARFEQRFDFHIEERTLQLLKEAISLMDRVSGDRIRHELNHIIDEPRAAEILERLAALNLLDAIHPELKWDAWLKEQFKALRDLIPGTEWELEDQAALPGFKSNLAYIIWMMRLSPGQADQVSKRLNIPIGLQNTIQAAIKLFKELPHLAGRPPSQLVIRLDDLPALARYAVYCVVTEPTLREMLLRYVQSWRKIHPTIDGDSLRQLGLPPSPEYRTILTSLRAAWLDGKVSTPDQEKAFLNELISQKTR